MKKWGAGKWESRMDAAFRDHLDGPILFIGRDSFSPRQIVQHFGLLNFRAVRGLNAISKYYKVRSVRDFARRVSLEQLWAFGGVGTRGVLILLRAMDHLSVDSEAWFKGTSIPAAYAKRREQKKATRRKKKAGRLLLMTSKLG